MDPAESPLTESRSYETTRVLPHAFGGFDSAPRLNILDVGPIMPESVEFFYRFRCRLYIAGLFDVSVPGRSVDSLSAFLGHARNVVFDVCLLWDYLNYLDDAALEEFVSVLDRHVHYKTRVYAIAAYATDLPLNAHRYAVMDYDRLAVQPVAETVPHPLSQTDILRAMPRFEVQRTALRRDNRLELLLRTSLTSQS